MIDIAATVVVVIVVIIHITYSPKSISYSVFVVQGVHQAKQDITNRVLPTVTIMGKAKEAMSEVVKLMAI